MRIFHLQELVGWKAAGTVLLCAILCLSFCGCIFSPRDPEPPTGNTIEYLPRTSPVNVWTNIELSLANNDAFGWDDAIHADFEYFPDSEAESQFPGAFDGWDRDRELVFINAFYDSNPTNDPAMRNVEFEVPPASGGESIWENVIYYLVVNSDGSETRYRASAIITFAIEANFWKIKSWRDQQGESNPDNPDQLLSTMGVLRGTFGSK